MPFLGITGIGGLVAFLKQGVKPTVLGGVLSEDATYYYRSFKGNGSLTVTGGILTADVLTIAGGGGSGGNFGGGGGAGGLLYSAAQSLTPTAYAVTVGAGSANDVFIQGSNSSFASLIAYGGGSGYGGVAGGGGPNSAQNGGSGGGGGGVNGASNTSPWLGGTAVAGQGNVGSSGTYNRVGGAGGGAGAAGSGQAGGAGSSAYSAWGLATGTGENVTGTVYFAGGGGGGGLSGYSGAGAGGYGGGGAGSNVSGGSSVAGTVNTGGGGGGGAGNAGGSPGGSGVVIVRYLKAAVKTSTDAFEHIGTIYGTGTSPVISFNGIPSSQYKHLQLRVVGQVAAGGATDLYLKFNNDSTTGNYRDHRMYGFNNTMYSGVVSTNSIYCGTVGAVGDTAPVAAVVIDLIDPFSSSKNKTLKYFAGKPATDNYIAFGSGLWLSTSPVTSIQVSVPSGSFTTASRFSLYGSRG